MRVPQSPPKRVVIAGFGDTGLLVAIHLGTHGLEVVGVGPKPCLASGQELGTRLTQPSAWKEDYLMPFDRYQKLDGVRILQGRIDGVDLDARRVRVTTPDGSERTEDYDVLVIATGVTNGFWRTPDFESTSEISQEIDRVAQRIAGAGRLAVVGAGATGVSVAANVAERFPDKDVHLFYGRDRPLPGYHPKVRDRLVARLEGAGVHLHPHHRAMIPEGFACDRLTDEPVTWSTGQPAFDADLTLWAVGRTRPNTSFLPAALLDDEGFVKTDDTLRVPGQPDVFAVGDVAASDPNRSSARNWGYRLVAHNVRARLAGDEASMQHYDPPAYRWGSILGVQRDGLRVFQPNGRSFRFPGWSVRRLLFPIAVRRFIYKGIRRAAPPSAEGP